MAPAKSRTAHEEAKSETPNSKEKNGHATAGQHSNGKARRVASAAGSQLRDVTNAASLPPTAASAPPAAAAAAAAAAAPEITNPGLQWASFDRSVLHAYSRVYQLNTPSAFENEYHRWVLAQPGGIGLQSPTMARRKDLRRQSKDLLATSARKHFNGLGTQENDVIVDFLHKIRTQGVAKPTRKRKSDAHTHEPDR